MRTEVEIAIAPQDAANPGAVKMMAARSLHVGRDEITHVNLLKRSIDSRSRNVLVRLRLEVFVHEDKPLPQEFRPEFRDVRGRFPVVIVGAGPAGLFAALKLIRCGFKPVILERGKDVSARKQDIALLNRKQLVNPDSNYCFGEGGAGTFSDGKLYTRSTKKGDVSEILKLLVFHGASADILVDAHPHIGTDKLPAIITNLRQTILDAGGEIHFNARVSDLMLRADSITGVVDQKRTRYEGKAVILAAGHSARDIYSLLAEKKIEIMAKGFAAGIRVEHPQELIDKIQYHGRSRGEYLPAATYGLVHQADGRGVFSFCMCPGGNIVPSATGLEQVVMNGMSNSARNSPYANAGIVVQVEPGDLPEYEDQGVLSVMRFQEYLEKTAFLAGGSSQVAPAQRLTDFLTGKPSSTLPGTSYFPGVVSCRLDELLPPFISRRLREAFLAFEKKMHGFITEEAVILGVESRTSSPVRIPRDDQTLEHIRIRGLYPCGEGAGYAGGIVSSAIDGVRCAEKIALKSSGS